MPCAPPSVLIAGYLRPEDVFNIVVVGAQSGILR
jgi:hypothetical protein